MSDPIRFLNSLGHALSTMNLYADGHPARERAVGSSFEALQQLLATEPLSLFSFLDGEVISGQQVLRQLKDWDWGIRLAKANVQRVEFVGAVTLEEFEGFLSEIFQRMGSTEIDSSEVRQMQGSSIRFGTIGVRGVDEEALVAMTATLTTVYSLDDEAATVQWMHEQVASGDKLPLLEADAVVRSLSLAMHGQSQVILPLLELKSFDQYTTTHSSNVAVLSMALSEQIGLAARDVRAFGVAGLLHDLGKVRIPKDILTKPGALTDEERDVMRQHPSEGARLILEREKRLDLAAVVAYEHHIMVNGTGYPPLQFQRECHFGSKLVHVCDVYDALCTNRPYRDAWHSEHALVFLRERAGLDFDAELVTAFCKMILQSQQQHVALTSRE